MEELVDGYCFQTGGLIAELERNSFMGCIPVSITAKGDITIIPCGDGIEASAKEAFHAGVAKYFGKDKPTEKAEKAEKVEKAEKAAVYTSDCKKYTLLHPCFPFQERVFPEHIPSECNPPYRKYFQLEFDPAGCVPPAKIKAGYPYFCYSMEIGAVDGIYIPVVAHFPDLDGTLTTAILNRFQDTDGLAATYSVSTPWPVPPGHTGAGLMMYMGGGGAGDEEHGDWARHWVLLTYLRVVPYFYTDSQYRPKLLKPHEAPAGFHTNPAPSSFFKKPGRKEVGQLLEYCAIMASIPLRGVSSSSGVRVRAVPGQPTYAARLWATQWRDPVANPLPRPLLRLTGANVPLGVALYATSGHLRRAPSGGIRGAFQAGPQRGRA
jgi:hypothetical protein